MRDVGASELIVLTFDRDGRIARERTYSDQSTLETQADGDPDAAKIPAIPTTTELHVARAATTDPAVLAWTDASEAKLSRDNADPTVIDEHAGWDCSLGFHGTTREQLATAATPWHTAFPDSKYTATNVWSVEDYVIVEERFTGTQQGKLFDIEASHRPVSWHWIKIWRVDGGKIVHGWQWGNWNELERQITTPATPKHKPACSISS
jgi:predicted ester cyclase